MKVLIVASGKGGVGKTQTTAMLGKAIACYTPSKVALLDLDVCGPNLARVVGVPLEGVEVDEEWFYPKQYVDPRAGDGIGTCETQYTLEVFSSSFLMPADVAMAWDGGRRGELIRELLTRVKWSDPDVLICDSPPGTGDELLSVLKYAGKIDGLIIVTTGARESVDDAKRLVALATSETYQVPILGLVENMGHLPAAEGVGPALFSDGIDYEAELGIPRIASVPYSRKLTVADYADLARAVASAIGLLQEADPGLQP